MAKSVRFHHHEEVSGSWPYRPTIRGTRHLAVAGHYLAAHAGFAVLEAGGNAIDAGVAAGITEEIVQCDQVTFAGVAPIMIYLAERGEVITISGVGTWPRAASCEFFQSRHGGAIPEGILRTVVPAAPAAWLLALERFGTMSFADVAAAALRFARDGFPIHPFTAAEIDKRQDHYRRWPSNAAIFLPDGRPPEPGELFVQADLGGTLQFLIDEEAAATKHSREAGLRAVHDAFYKGDIAGAIVRYHEDNGGLLTTGDLAEFRVEIEPPERTEFQGIEVLSCGFWCQGPVLLQALNLLAGFPLAEIGHNTVSYIHTVAEALKLGFADRHRYYGDPRHVEVPAAGLLSSEYAAKRRELIRDDLAWPEMPPAGDAWSIEPVMASEDLPAAAEDASMPAADTTFVCTRDRQGNVFAASPSDPSYDTVIIPGTGLCPSSRGTQSWADPNHPSSVQPGKRPRLTPNPAIALRDGEPFLVFGTPGGDVQPQAMLQAFLNVAVFGMDPQNAVEAPRFVSKSFPDSFSPHDYFPGQLNLEGRIPSDTGEALAALGHRVEWWPDRTSRAGGVGMVEFDAATGVFHAGADFRRAAYALGW